MSALVEKYGEEYAHWVNLDQKNVLEVYKSCMIPKENIGKDPEDEVRTKVFTVDSCGKDSPEMVFSRKKLAEHRFRIKYLLGQLKVTHDSLQAFTLPMGFINYKNEPWTKDNGTLMALYYLGVATGSMPQFATTPEASNIASTTKKLTLRLSPEDPACIAMVKTIEDEKEARRKAEEEEQLKKFLAEMQKLNGERIRGYLEKARESVRIWENKTVEDIIPDGYLRRKIRTDWRLRKEYEDEYARELERRRAQLADLEARAREVGIE